MSARSVCSSHWSTEGEPRLAHRQARQAGGHWFEPSTAHSRLSGLQRKVLLALAWSYCDRSLKVLGIEPLAPTSIGCSGPLCSCSARRQFSSALLLGSSKKG